MLEFTLASSNAHKAQEFSELFAAGPRIVPAPMALDVDETGATFVENALIKARTYHERFKVPTLADDSGLSVEGLPHILAVQSARFLPEKPDYKDKCAEILRLLSGRPRAERRAHFTCVLCFYLSPSEVYFFEGRVHGEIGDRYAGSDGFGYDPIFVPTRSEGDGKTLAELAEWKNLNSHRAKAVQSALKFFKLP